MTWRSAIKSTKRENAFAKRSDMKQKRPHSNFNYLRNASNKLPGIRWKSKTKQLRVSWATC